MRNAFRSWKRRFRREPAWPTWRGRIGDKLEMLPRERLRVAHDAGALKGDDLARVTIDTTAPPRNVTHPTEVYPERCRKQPAEGPGRCSSLS